MLEATTDREIYFICSHVKNVFVALLFYFNKYPNKLMFEKEILLFYLFTDFACIISNN